ncbi:pyridoxamine 5'-phosphate oxidase family protein [Actomonas aquatica]|uniref:Pyridoxamine 5'-phosphate oxidase family protein n=1 Tax=Actomonas aquatica TaxID=2866162 RepID=A0ABZ1CB79_9BACT|nr:pyridoxamine 5'-phosphate oxidase family protein [Opitutus sp. WL0086]WRQ88711.1 pyridoxamine 5'-phosphate oxidase family protein [Opitutus sp. WL0086]
MNENFTHLAFGPSALSLQERYGSRFAYSRVAQSGERFRLTPSEIDFIRERDGFYFSSVGANGWPYVQFRGGPTGFLKILDERTLGFADFGGNKQFISMGNMADDGRVVLFLMDYARRQRLKIWAEARWTYAEEDPELINRLQDPTYPAGRAERAVVLTLRAYDWNCPQHIPQRYTLDEIRRDPDLLRQLGTAA